ncbi:winged helix-turn-helix domain-containing protein [Natronomonas marina]|jgi:predicted DNA-binding ArsR family transcriptional regulator|uniref:winged helix-turn-helix domain-containing protein n=1 Tax=Natronomonas marina TaxID=2961939 RepID=UPI0020C9F809|nr:helix-turn-helix domain-containing protein [Natronomonas marina]
MSQSPTVSATGRYSDSASETVRRVDGDEEIQRLLHVLEDADCRDVLDATSDAILTADEVSDTCSLPLSTTYRKLDLLTDAGLLAERTRICPSGKHASEYFRTVEQVLVSVAPCGEMRLQVTHRADAERVESFGTDADE